MIAVYAFAAWTVFVWGTRISNVVDDADSSTLDLILAVALTALGVVVVATAWRRRPAWPVPTLVVATVAAWALRTPPLLLDADHGAAFKAVHAGLALVSVVLAVLAWRSWRSLSSPVTVSASSGAGRAT
ncbi:MAG TPA: hypothetical protein VGV63_03265 [Acidimicrobiales bacterium]|nr:hypothetical protein [Acidimicrobiales bacterium]